MRSWLCALGLLSVAVAEAQVDKTAPSPIRRVVIYKDGHCLTEREVMVDADKNPVRIENSFNALMGGVWANARHKTVQLGSVYARLVEEKRKVPPANLAELLLLNDGKPVVVTVMYPATPQPHQPVQTERYEGTLRVFKPSLAYEDAHPTAEPPPDYTPQLTAQPTNRWDWQLPPPPPPDYVQDRFSRLAQQATFAVETPNGLAMFTPAQVKQLEFKEPPVREREVTVKRPVLELTLSGAGRGERVPIRLCSLEKGIRWMPEYQLTLPSARASEATLTLSGVILNELQDLQEVEAAVAIGSIQFMMSEYPSPLGLREAFRKLSRWFGEEATPMYYWYGAPPRITDVISRGGFGGAVAPSAPGMGFEQRGASLQATDTIAFLNLPRLTLPKGSVARLEIAQQKLSVEHAYLWIHDLSERERNAYTSWSAQRDRQRFTTLEELAYSVAQERLFRNEVYEAVILRNTGSTPWTTAPVTILRDNTPVGQDILLFTPPGEEAFIFITPAPRLGVVCTVEADPSQQPSPNLGYTPQNRQRVTVRVQNLNEQPVRLVARLRFVGHYIDATREPKRILAKTATDPSFWHWYYGNRLQQNPYTELVWDVEAPPGVSEWQFRYERKALY